jgi:hypothetical protein
MNVVKFPYSVSRRVHSRKPRRSKNGTPEERAKKRPTLQQRHRHPRLSPSYRARAVQYRISLDWLICGDLKGLVRTIVARRT